MYKYSKSNFRTVRYKNGKKVILELMFNELKWHLNSLENHDLKVLESPTKLSGNWKISKIWVNRTDKSMT